MKSSRGSWDRSVTQLLKLKVSVGLVWLALRVSALLLVPANRPWKYCHTGRQCRVRKYFPLPPTSTSPHLASEHLCLVKICGTAFALFTAPGTQLKLDVYTLD